MQDRSTMALKFGKKPARPGAVKFRLKDYVNIAALPQPPAHFGHEQLIGSKSWQVLGNDHYGDCVWAGAAHETMMWNLEASHTVTFNEQSVLSDYSAVTGFTPTDPATDQGTDMQTAASYRRKTGVLDASGTRHKVAAYLAITPGDLHEHFVAVYLFGAVGIGIRVPKSAIQQFREGKPWSPSSEPDNIVGGHYVPLVAKRTNIECVTWGQIQPMTVSFFEKYNDESLAYVSLEMLTHNKSPEGFDAEQLEKDLASLS